MLQFRKQRFPSAWECEMVFRHAGRMVTEIRNVSESGMRCIVSAPVQLYEKVRLTVNDTRIQGEVCRIRGSVVGIRFDGQLTADQVACLRQFRRLAARRIG